MARRNLLHVSKLDQFKAWLEAQVDIVVLQPKGAYEALRFEESGVSQPMPIVFFKGKEHLSCNEQAVPYVHKFIKESK